MAIFLLVLYGLLALTALCNWLFMQRARAFKGPSAKVCVLIPARNEAHNLAVLLPALGPDVEVFVFDDESNDGTADVARSFGAKVITPGEPLPKGWTGKNRACDSLAKAAVDSSADWWIFLDADVRPSPDFLKVMARACGSVPASVGVISGFGYVVPGEGVEPLFMAWVGWILVATNPFWIVSRTRFGHNYFTNGQIHAWRPDIYRRLLPNETLKGAILEDVRIGRLLAKNKVGVEVALFTRDLNVEMYKNWREALDGMSKNSYEIMGSPLGTIFLAWLFAFLAVAFIIWPSWIAFGLFVLSGLFVALTLRANALMAPLMPVICLIGSFTLLRSLSWHRKKKVVWKGRTY